MQPQQRPQLKILATAVQGKYRFLKGPLSPPRPINHYASTADQLSRFSPMAVRKSPRLVEKGKPTETTLLVETDPKRWKSHSKVGETIVVLREAADSEAPLIILHGKSRHHVNQFRTHIQQAGVALFTHSGPCVASSSLHCGASRSRLTRRCTRSTRRPSSTSKISR